MRHALFIATVFGGLALGAAVVLLSGVGERGSAPATAGDGGDDSRAAGGDDDEPVRADAGAEDGAEPSRAGSVAEPAPPNETGGGAVSGAIRDRGEDAGGPIVPPVKRVAPKTPPELTTEGAKSR